VYGVEGGSVGAGAGGVVRQPPLGPPRTDHRGEGRRPLSLRGWRAVLGRFRLPAYSAVHDLLGTFEERAVILGLWRDVFGDAPPWKRWVFDLWCAFVWRVDEQLFPIDLTAMDSWFNSGEEGPLYAWPIPLRGWGVPWELETIDCFVAYARPVYAVCASQLEAPFEAAVNWLDTWWDKQGRESPVWGLSAGREGIRELQEGLRAESPGQTVEAWVGAGDVIDGILKESGNQFLDHPGRGWYFEYDMEEEWFWSTADIARLVVLYDEVRPAVERMVALEEWWEESPGLRGAYVDWVCRLAEGGWYIEDGEVIWDAG